MDNHSAGISLLLNKMFRNKLSLAALIITPFVAMPSIAHDVTVNITGTVTNTTCSVSPSSINKTVDIGSFNAMAFAHPGESTEPKQFTIDLQNCGAVANGMNISFSGTTDDNNPELLKLSPESSAGGIAIELMDSAQKIIPIGSSLAYPITAGAANVSLVFYASMVANGEEVKTGHVISSVTFDTSYP